MTELNHHLTDEEIVTSLDEPEAPYDRFHAHLAACETCRARLAAMEDLFDVLRAEPPAAGEADLAAGRERILSAVAERPRRARRHVSRRAVWVPLAAAAAVAALVIWAPREPEPPEGSVRVAPEDAESAPSAIGAHAAFPVIVQATQAAEEVLQAPGGDEAVSLLDAPLIDEIDADGSPFTADYDDRVELEEAFADLPMEDREAILDELASVSFEF
ncbi:MAG: hypothetical protein ACREMD_13535 [Gemmatimonadota bacterium]